MTTALDKIIAYKREEVAALKAQTSLSSLEAAAKEVEAPRGFAQALLGVASDDKNALICEIKRRSPSAGEIKVMADPTVAAQAYEAGGASCISVLTDGPSFGGSLDDLKNVRAAVDLPVLRKDFMIDALQIAEARAAGADAILIILAAVDDALAADLHAAADAYDLSVLLEVHDEIELERALKLPSPLFGVNNRNLKTFTTNLAVTERLSNLIPTERLLISESGVKTADDISRLRRARARGFLIGESVMRADDPADAVRKLANAA
ncbi:MAG: indole-3-glycerol phosphate synthase TrpC [Pseudomonadota bacterium]